MSEQGGPLLWGCGCLPQALPLLPIPHRFKQLLMTQADKFSLAEVRTPCGLPHPSLAPLQGPHPAGHARPWEPTALSEAVIWVRCQAGRAVCTEPWVLGEASHPPSTWKRLVHIGGGTEKSRQCTLARVGPSTHGPLMPPLPSLPRVRQQKTIN